MEKVRVGYDILKALTFKQYRIIDIALLSVLFIIGETIVTLASGRWFLGVPFSLSLAITFLCIMMMRWNGWAAVTAVLGGVILCLATSIASSQPVGGEQFAIYSIGNLFALFALFVFRIFGKEKVKNKAFYTIIYIVCVYAFAEVGRFAVSFIFERNIGVLPMLLTTDSMSLVFALVVVLAVRKMDGLFEDQKKYLFRIEKEKEKEKKSEEEFAERV